MKPKIGMKVAHTGKALTKEQIEKGVGAKQEKTTEGHNPPSWVTDEAAWTKAKGAAAKTYDESDDAYWAVVTHIYQNMKAKCGSWRDDAVRAAHGEVTGKPSFETLRQKVNSAIQEDARFDTDLHGQPEGSPGDYEPWCVDILVPDDDGRLCAVIQTDDNRLVRHYFTWDGESVELDNGPSEPTEVTQVYAKEIAEKEKPIKAAGSKDGANKGHAQRKSARAEVLSQAAHEASTKAHETDEDGDHDAAAEAHEAAADAHEVAYRAHAKHTGDEEAMDHHRDQGQAHKAMAIAHGASKEDDDAKASEPVLHCRASSATFNSETPESDFQWMPGGLSTITATYRGRPITMSVECDADTAAAVQASFDAHVKASPRRPPFGCVEHREEEATFHPKRFEWKEEPEPGVYCSAEWTPLGTRNVRGKIHTSFSPSFTTDADYSKAVCGSCGRKAKSCECDGELSFPDGIRGSASNPAHVTGVSHKSVGSLTNWPAFKNILPVRAKQADTQPGDNDGSNINNKGLTMKVKLLKARGSHAAGAVADLQDKEAVEAIAAKDAMAFETWEEMETMRTERKAQREQRIKDAVTRAKARKAIAPKDETVLAKHLEQLEKGRADVDFIVEFIDAMAPLQAETGTLSPGGLSRRVTTRVSENGDPIEGRLELVSTDPRDVGSEYLRAREPMGNLIRGGRLREAAQLSVETSAMIKTHLLPIIAKGGDVMLKDLVRAADTSDPNSQVGTLATGLILMRNLGYLKNKLGWMPYISTDLRNEPALYGQNILTRYITPPNVLTYVPGVGYTSDATTISNAAIDATTGEAATQTSGTRTPSAPSTTDRNVIMNKHKGVEIVFPTSTLGSTMRNLFGEQQGAQFYSLAEQINKDFIIEITNSTWTGVIGNTYSLGGSFALPGFIALKSRFTANKMPDVGRFVLLHSFYHDNVLTDSNLVTAKAIMALINKDMSAFESGELPMLYGIKPLETQLAAASAAGTLVTPTDPATIASVAPFFVGLAGNMSSMLFVARVPQDYTKVFPDVPATAAIEILTEPDSGLSILFTKYVDHALAQVSARVALMYGFKQGDSRQGFRLTP
jgi:hypothetical protein